MKKSRDVESIFQVRMEKVRALNIDCTTQQLPTLLFQIRYTSCNTHSPSSKFILSCVTNRSGDIAVNIIMLGPCALEIFFRFTEPFGNLLMALAHGEIVQLSSSTVSHYFTAVRTSWSPHGEMINSKHDQRENSNELSLQLVFQTFLLIFLCTSAMHFFCSW